MVWHIFKKDVRLLWPLPLAVVLAGALSALYTLLEGHFYQPLLERLTFFLPYLPYLGIAVVAVAVVQQDALVQSRDDWLVRPILRRDLALAKVLFVLLTVNVPLLIIDVLQQLALHFPLSVSVGVAGSRALFMVFLLSLPALMLGAVTRSLVDAFLFGTATAAGILFLLIGIGAAAAVSLGLNQIPAMVWIELWGVAAVIAMGSAATITFQYSTRRALIARGIGLATVLAAVCMLNFVPASVTLAIQESLWGPSNSDGIGLHFDPSRHGGMSGHEPRLAYGLGPPVTPASAAGMAAILASTGRQIQKVRLPLTISGMHPGEILVADRINVRLVSMTGRVLYGGASVCAREASGIICRPNRLEVWPSAVGGTDVPREEALNLPLGLYQSIRNEPVRVEVTYALTRFAARSTGTIKATGGLKDLPEMGSCATRVDSDGDEVELGCLTDVGVPSCADVVLEDPRTSRRNPALHLCNPQYGPFRRGRFQSAVNRSQLSIPFRDRSGLAHYPVGGAAIEHARIDVTVYDPVAHFRARVTVPSVRLAEWAPPADESTAAVRY